MANNANKVFVGKPLVTGGIWLAPLGTALPTDADTALAAAYKAVGYVTDDGVTKTENRDTDKINAWGGDTIALIQKSFGVDLKFKMAEFLNEVPQKALYGDAAVTATPGTAGAPDTLAVAVTSEEPPHNVWVIEMKQGDKRVRVVLPDGQIGETGDVEFKDDDVASLDVTVSGFSDSTGAFYYVYTSSPGAAAVADEPTAAKATVKAA